MYSYTVAYNYNHILCRFLMTISRRSNMHTNQMYDQLYTYWQWIEVKFKIIYYCYLMTKSKKKKDAVQRTIRSNITPKAQVTIQIRA